MMWSMSSRETWASSNAFVLATRNAFDSVKSSIWLTSGVSDDSPESHARFSEKYSLPFPLIADTDREILDAYGTYGEKSMYGIKRKGTIRTSFLIDPDGIIRHVFKRPVTGEHAEEVLGRFAEVRGSVARN
jgi:thioredoxin-dependent peroxiredoxin